MAKQPRRKNSQTEALQSVPDRLPPAPEPGDMADRAQQFEPSVSPVTPGAVAEATSHSMASEPSEEDIRVRAYQRYLHRGGQHGGHVDDWIEAESELKKR